MLKHLELIKKSFGQEEFALNEAQRVFSTSPSTVLRILNSLIDQGHVSKIGATKGALYALNMKEKRKTSRKSA